MFPLAGVPDSLQHYDDDVSRTMTPPSLPEHFDELSGARREHEEYLYRCRLVHYHYVKSTMECNPLHYAAFTDPLYKIRGILFRQAGAPWEGETFYLKYALIQATHMWEEPTGGGTPGPVRNDGTEKKRISQASRGFECLQSTCSVGEYGWVSVEDYKSAVASLKEHKKAALADCQSAKERGEITSLSPD